MATSTVALTSSRAVSFGCGVNPLRSLLRSAAAWLFRCCTSSVITGSDCASRSIARTVGCSRLPSRNPSMRAAARSGPAVIPAVECLMLSNRVSWNRRWLLQLREVRVESDDLRQRANLDLAAAPSREFHPGPLMNPIVSARNASGISICDWCPHGNLMSCAFGSAFLARRLSMRQGKIRSLVPHTRTVGTEQLAASGRASWSRRR